MTIRVPDDWHLHLRDGAVMKAVLPFSSRHFARAIIMPNLVPPIRTTREAFSYKQNILSLIPKDHRFDPLMTLYLTEETNPDDVAHGYALDLIHAVKLYPAGATTNSQNGVGVIDKIYPVLERMESLGIPLCVHGEVTDPLVDIFDREAVFIDKVLVSLHRKFPALRIVMEHVTTEQGVAFVRDCPDNVAATITTHHLIINRNAVLAGGIRPHYYCLPVAKREKHRRSLRRAATSGERCFFLGTDSAPHVDALKQSPCGCAGIFSAPNTIACLAHVFEQEAALDRLEAFVSLNGPAFYRLPVNQGRLTLRRLAEPMAKLEPIQTGDGPLTVFDPMFPIHWIVDDWIQD